MVGVLIELVMLIPPSTVTVVIDAYTHNSTITSGDSVPLGTQLILVCQVVGLPYGTKLRFTSGHTSTTPLSFTWNCPDGLCFIAQRKSRRSYQNKFILAITTISTTYSGTYTCQVTDAGGQKANGSFTLNIAGKHHSVCSTKCIHMSGIQLPWHCYSKWTLLYYYLQTPSITFVHISIGGRVVHSEGRLIPHHFPITELQQINYLIRSGVTGYRVTCDVSRGPPSPRFNSPNGTLDTGGVSQRQYTRTTWLNVNTTNIDSFQSRDVYCDDMRTNYFYLYLTSSNNSE